MKKVGIIILSIVLLLIGAYLIINLQFNRPCSAPDRIGKVPPTAVWKGSCQEGFWFELVEVKELSKVYRLRIYNDYKGELELDANFIVKDDCKERTPQNGEILSKILTFENNIILFEKGFCDFKAQYPAYGGIRWENKINRNTN